MIVLQEVAQLICYNNKNIYRLYFWNACYCCTTTMVDVISIIKGNGTQQSYCRRQLYCSCHQETQCYVTSGQKQQKDHEEATMAMLLQNIVACDHVNVYQRLRPEREAVVVPFESYKREEKFKRRQRKFLQPKRC